MTQFAIAGGIAGHNTLRRQLRTVGNVTGQTAGADITVPGLGTSCRIIGAIAGDGTDLGAATFVITAANTMTCTVNTASKKLVVFFYDPTTNLAGTADDNRGATDTTREYPGTYGMLDASFGNGKLVVDHIAGANGALTLTGITTADSILAMWCSDATIDLSGETYTVTATNTITPAGGLDTSSKGIVVLWWDESLSSPEATFDHNTNFPIASAEQLDAWLSALRISSGSGVATPGNITAGSFATMATADNVLAVGLITNAAGIGTTYADAAYTAVSGGLAQASSENLSSVKLFCLWVDASVAAL